jgi:hypothetical protein
MNNSESSYFKTKKSYIKYKTSIKETLKKYKKELIKRKTQKNNNILNKNLGKEIINCYNKNGEETADNLRNLIIKNIDNKKFEKYEKDFISFDKSVQGKSGAVVGYLKSEPNKVVKFYFNKTKPNYYNYFNTTKCLKINNNVNEVFANNILSNLELLNVFTKEELDVIKPYILQLKDSGFADKGSYIVIPLVGFEYKVDNTIKKYITNFTDIIVLNHKILLDKAIQEENYEIIKLYDQYLSSLLTNFFNVIKLLQEKIEYIHTDFKLNNIFVSRQINNNPEFNELKNYGFEIDFIPIISDLEKSIYKINGIRSITIPRKPLKVKFVDKFGYGLIYHVRYKCKIKFLKICPKFKSSDYDIIFMIVNLLVILNRNKTKNIEEINNYLNKTLEIIQTTININNDELKILLNIINEHIFNDDNHTGLYLNNIITEICKKL